jgi:uncharacterized protein (TIGR03435 family)
VSLSGTAFLNLPAAAQNGQTRPLTDKDFRFEVVSIRPMTPGSSSFSMNTSPSQNGFDTTLSLWQAIILAYSNVDYRSWGSVQVLNAPNWIGEFYNISARVSQADLKAWQSQGREHELLRAALRAVLKDRCRLAIHEQPSKGQIWELVIGKRGPQLKAAVANTVLPAGAKLESGGVLVQTVDHGTQVKTYYGATMQDLADFLSILARQIPVRDRTGLTGRYDFTFHSVQIPPDEEPVFSYPIDHLGLQIRRGSENRPILAIDHIEKPAAN